MALIITREASRLQGGLSLLRKAHSRTSALPFCPKDWLHFCFPHDGFLQPVCFFHKQTSSSFRGRFILPVRQRIRIMFIFKNASFPALYVDI